MKKIYFLFVLAVLSLRSFGLTATFYATGSTGSYKTGNTTATVRADGNIMTTATTQRGWAVFDLSSLPAGITVTSVEIGGSVINYGGSGTPASWVTRGYAGDLSTVTTASTLFANCASGTIMSTASYGATTGNFALTSTAAGNTFIQSNAGNRISICFTGGNTRIYTIEGQTGASSTTGVHAPYITVTYSCTSVFGTVATATPRFLCNGANFSLSGTASGATTYRWDGPGGYTSTMASPSSPITASAATAGVYTLTAFNSTGCGVSDTEMVSLKTSPTTITGNASPCTGTSSTLSSSPSGGVWSLSSSTGATITAGGVVVAGSTTGTGIVTYTLPSTGCSTTVNITILQSPAPITGPPTICQTGTGTYADTSAGGTWTLLPTVRASINSTTGFTTGITFGSAIVTYTVANGCRATMPITVEQNVANIGMTVDSVCPLLSINLTNSVSGGLWSTSSPNATVNSATGAVTGVLAGTAIITYSNSCNSDTALVKVRIPPAPITGVFHLCQGQSNTLANATPGGLWSSSNTPIAAVGAATGVVSAGFAGSATITYTATTGCIDAESFTVYRTPSAIFGSASACPGTTTMLYDTSAGGIWSSADTMIARINSIGMVSGITASTTTITYTFPATGCYTTTPVVINPLPGPIIGNSIFCANVVDTFLNPTPGGTWSSSNSSLASINSFTGQVNTLMGGTPIITYTAGNGCYKTKTILIHPAPAPLISINYWAGTLSTASYFTAYQWYRNGVMIPGANSNRVAITDVGNYTVWVRDTFTCENMSPMVNISSVNVTEVDMQHAVSIYPNPATGQLNIEAPVPVSAVISTIEGKISRTFTSAKSMDISSLPAGMYMVVVYDQEGRKLKTEKLIKE